MTADSYEYQSHNLAFFEKVILQPALAYSVQYASAAELADMSDDRTPIVSSLGLIESTLWLRLGAQFDFFDKEMIGKTVADIEPVLSRAWTILLQNSAVSSDKWCDFMSTEAEPKLMMDTFLNPSTGNRFELLRNLEQLEYLNQCFLGHLLLTSEVIFDPRVMMFLERVGWDTDDAFRIRLRRSEDLYRGFGNHIEYANHSKSHTFNLFMHFADTLNPTRTDTLHEINDFVVSLHDVVSERLMILSRPQSKIRCLELGGEIAAMMYEPGPEWQEARMSIFDQITFDAGFAPDEESWNIFADIAERRLREMRSASEGQSLNWFRRQPSRLPFERGST